VAIRLRAGGSGIALLALGLPLSACGDSGDAAAADVAEHFYEAVSGKDGAAACDLLTPSAREELEESSGKSCDAAVIEETRAPGEADGAVEVFGTMAQVSFENDVVFLARLPDGWRVQAAGCSPSADGPYSCTVQGG
jgi:hypothetical protein